MNWDKFWEYILGDMPLEKFFAYALLMGAGALIYFATNVKIATTKSDMKFSWGYMVRDNLLRLLVVFISIAASILWYEEFFGVALNGKLAFMQGLSIDAVTGMLLKGAKEQGPLKGARKKLVQKYTK
jgi:hypothetical protein